MFEYVTSDALWFPLLQGVTLAAGAISAFQEWRAQKRAGRGGATLRVGRGPESMALLYGASAFATGVLVAICLSVEVAANHRVLWVIVDTAATAYVCVLNPWSRNLLLGYADRLTKLEQR